MTNPIDEPDRVDPAKQSGRPFMLTAVPIGIVLVLLIMLAVAMLAG